MDEATKFIQALSTAAWPALVFFVVWTYRKQVAAIIESAKGRRFTIEVGGQKLSMEDANQQQQKLIADLQKQLLELRGKVEGFQVSPEAALAAPTGVPASNAVLWVDDTPKNNSYFIELLQQRGYRVDLATSTSEGIRLANTNTYRAVLSDMGRAEDGQFNDDAGLDLLQLLHREGSTLPFVIFCSTRKAAQFRQRAKELGARAITSSAMELRAVLDEIAPESIGPDPRSGNSG